MARAKVKCTVELGEFHGSIKGYNALMDSEAVQQFVKKPAERIHASCSAGFRPYTGDGSGYRLKKIKGKRAHGYVVATDGLDGAIHEHRTNSLKRAMGSLGGGA